MSSTSKNDEKDLLLRLRDGDDGAFAHIYHTYKNRLIANLLGLVKSPDLVEELMQELFLKLWEHRARIDVDKSIQAYLYKVARNLVYDTMRKAMRDRQLYRQLLYSLEEGYSHVEERIIASEYQEQLRKAIDLMPPQQRRVYTLCKLESKTYEEVATMLGISTGTVNVHIKKANAFLKSHFASNPGLTAMLVAHALLVGVV